MAPPRSAVATMPRQASSAPVKVMRDTHLVLCTPGAAGMIVRAG